MVGPAGRTVRALLVAMTLATTTVAGSSVVPASAAIQDDAVEGGVSEGHADEGRTVPAPEHAIEIYRYAAATADCPIDWVVLGGVAAVASDHTRLGGEPRLDHTGDTVPAIIGGPPTQALDTSFIADADAEQVVTEGEFDRTVGPFQFLPSTWEAYGLDGNGDGRADPNNLWDAAAGAANHLCAVDVIVDRDAALTAYFGRDDYNAWVGRKIAALDAVRDLAGPVPPRQVPEQLVAISVAGASVEILPSPIDGETAAGPSSESPPLFVGPPSPPPPVQGDWNGDGIGGSVSLEPDADGGNLRIVYADDVARPYGRGVALSELLGPDVDPVALAPELVAGDWNGDGVDTAALIVHTDGRAEALQLDRRGQVFARVDLGQVAPGSQYQAIVAPVAQLAAVASEPWQIVRVHGGSELSLWRVGDIAVAESVRDDLAAMIAAAQADGIMLDGWGWRSHDAQIALRHAHCADAWTTPASACSPPTAIPGSSRHEYGVAIDFHAGGQAISAASPEFAWLAANAERFGFFNLESEPWHWSIDGG